MHSIQTQRLQGNLPQLSLQPALQRLRRGEGGGGDPPGDDPNDDDASKGSDKPGSGRKDKGGDRPLRGAGDHREVGQGMGMMMGTMAVMILMTVTEGLSVDESHFRNSQGSID